MGEKHRNSEDSASQASVRKKRKYHDRAGLNFLWTNTETNVLRNLSMKQHSFVSNKSRDPTTSKQFYNVDGLQRRTFSAVYTKVCSLRSVGQKSIRWSDQEDDIIRKITKEQHEALTSLLNRRKNGGKTSTQLCNINGLQHRTVNAVYIRLCNLIASDQGSNPLPSSQESNLPPSSQEIILPPSRQRINSWTDKEDGIIRKLIEEQRKALGHIKRLTRGKNNSHLCNINGLEHRTVTAVYGRFYALLPPAGPKNNWTDQELGNVYRLTVEQRKELIALKDSGRATILCSLPGLQSRTNNSVLGKWYDIHSDKNWTEEEANFVRHLTKKQLNKLEEVEKKNWAGLGTEVYNLCEVLLRKTKQKARLEGVLTLAPFRRNCLYSTRPKCQ